MLKRLFAFCTVLLILVQFVPSVSAETIVDLEKESSISVRAVYEGAPLEGMKLNCIRVGDLVPSGDSYYFKCLFDSSIIYNDKNIHDKSNPEKMLELVKKGTNVGVSNSVNKEGTVKFSNLKAGLYLIYQKEAFSAGGSKYTVAPFLVTIPYDGKYDVDIKSKASLDLFPEEPAKPTEPETPPKLPQTGQLRWPIPVMACSGMACFIIGWYLCFARRRDFYEK